VKLLLLLKLRKKRKKSKLLETLKKDQFPHQGTGLFVY